MPKLAIIYRVCDSVDMLHTTAQEPPHESSKNSKRFYDIPKQYLIMKCMLSVRDAIAYATENVFNNDSRMQVEFICVHDNCSNGTLDFIKSVVPDAKMVESDGHGNGNSFTTCANIAKNIVDDDTIVFFLEDDYSFLSKDGLFKSIGMIETLRNRNGIKCALFLDDYPDRYAKDGFSGSTSVAVTPFGHLMSINSCTFSFMTYSSVVKEHYYNLIGGGDNLDESVSIDLLWKDVPLFCPIPAITLHCQLKTHIPQYLNAENLKQIMEA